MRSSRLGLGLSLSLLMHLILLLAPAALFSRLLAPWESPPPALEIEARLRPIPRPQKPPAHRPRQPPSRTPLPTLAAAPLAVPALPEDFLAPPPSPPEIQATAQPAPSRSKPETPGTERAEPPTVAAGLELPRAGRIKFAVNRGDQGFVIGRAVHRWRRDGSHYEISNVTETTGLAALFRPVTMVQTSQGEMLGNTLQPHEYRSERDGKRIDAASFDWPGAKLSFGGGQSAKLTGGAQDMLSAFYQLGRQGYEGGAELALTTGKKFETYRFIVQGEEKLALRFGEVRTIHLKSGGEPGRDATEVWLAPSLRGLPLKIRYTDRNGESFEQIAEEIEFEDQAATTDEKR